MANKRSFSEARARVRASAERAKGEITIKTPSGKPYTFRPSFNAQCAAEKLTGQFYDEITREAARGSSTAMRVLLWSALQAHHGAEIQTLEQAGDLIQELGFGEVMGTFAELAKVNAPASQGEDGENPPAAQRGTGDGSSLSPAATA